MKTIILLAAAGIFFGGCASVGPKEVPIIKSEEVPAIELKSIKPKVVQLVVEDSRKINQDAGNSKAVEARVFAVLSEALAKSGISVDQSAKTHLHLEIADYNPGQDQGECVQFELTCRMKAIITAQSFACYQLKNAIFGFSMGGDISKAYQNGLNILVTGFNEQVRKYETMFSD